MPICASLLFYDSQNETLHLVLFILSIKYQWVLHFSDLTEIFLNIYFNLYSLSMKLPLRF